MKIYAITKGDYSDYHICALTTDKEKADKLADMLSTTWEPAEVEEYDDGIVNELIAGHKLLYRCEVDYSIDGPIHAKEENDLEYGIGSGTEVLQTSMKNQYWTYVFANDADEAIKIAADRFAKHRAQEEGL